MVGAAQRYGELESVLTVMAVVVVVREGGWIKKSRLYTKIQ